MTRLTEEEYEAILRRQRGRGRESQIKTGTKKEVIAAWNRRRSHEK